jgi:hypothetical protein
MGSYDPLEALTESKAMRKMTREWVSTYPSIKQMAMMIMSRRKMGSPSTVNGYIQGVKRVLDFLEIKDPEEALRQVHKEGLDFIKAVDKRGMGYIARAKVEKYAEKNGLTVDEAVYELASIGLKTFEVKDP